MAGKIFLIPTVLGDSSPEKVLPSYVFKVIERLKHYIVEDLRTARRFIRSAGSPVPIDDMKFFELNKYTAKEDYLSFLDPVRAGHDTGLLSEAGVPCVADPGADIVAIAHNLDIKVVPLSGPSSIILALMASGMNGQGFVFHGYLPVNKAERTNAVKKLERDSGINNQSQIFMETPFRNMQMLDTLTSYCKPPTLLCIACDITLETEFISTRSIADWKKNKPDINKRPAIFIIQNSSSR
ncbi:MAG: SAM-dependent methyltransferase [Bacteroidales bacterium]